MELAALRNVKCLRGELIRREAARDTLSRMPCDFTAARAKGVSACNGFSGLGVAQQGGGRPAPQPWNGQRFSHSSASASALSASPSLPLFRFTAVPGAWCGTFLSPSLSFAALGSRKARCDGGAASAADWPGGPSTCTARPGHGQAQLFSVASLQLEYETDTSNED